MAGKTRPYEQFGPFILFKKLESDALGDLWRAARIDDRHLGPLVAVRRLLGGDRQALVQAASDARAIAPMLTGTSFVKDQIIDVVSGIPCIVHDYSGGRSLRHIVDRAHGGNGITPNPVPIDQAILIAERVALSLATTANLRAGGQRLSHGAPIPQFVWISDDGEIRVAGQQLGKGLVASLKDAKVAQAIGRFFSPEIRTSGEPVQSSEVYAMGALLYLLVTGNEPADPMHVSAFTQSVRAAKTTAGDPLPDDIRAILDKSLVIDPSRRFGSISDMKQALSALAHSGKYSATTFNLAFYLSTLMKKELEGETIEREKESKVNIAPYLEQQIELTTPPPPAAEKTKKSKMPLYAAAAMLAALVAGAAIWTMKPAAQAAKPLPAEPNRVKTQLAPAPAPQPAIAPTVAAPATATTASADPAAEKKAFEAAVSQKLQAEMAKLQSQFNKQLGASKPAHVEKAPAPVLTASIKPQPREPQVLDDRAPSAAALDERRLAAQQQAAATPPPIPAPAPVTQTVAVQQPEPQTAAPAPAVKEGDLVAFDEVDVRPQVISRPQLTYPPMAMRQKVQSTLILSVLVDENGDVQDVRILRGDPRFGFNNEATRLLRGTRFSPATKNGKRVKTWLPQPVEFKLQ